MLASHSQYSRPLRRCLGCPSTCPQHSQCTLSCLPDLDTAQHHTDYTDRGLTGRSQSKSSRSQSMQFVSRALAVARAYLPAMQSMQALSAVLAGVSKYLPAAQAMQSVSRVNLLIADHLPAMQSIHALHQSFQFPQGEASHTIDAALHRHLQLCRPTGQQHIRCSSSQQRLLWVLPPAHAMQSV